MSDDLIKVLLHNQGEDVETLWAFRLEGDDTRALVRLDNVPFLNAKPTYGDVIEVVADPAHPGFLSWDQGGDWERVHERIVEDGGRYAAIVDYSGDVDRYAELSNWARETHDFVFEGVRGPSDDAPGRFYMAVPWAVDPRELIAMLGASDMGFTFVLEHPV